MIEHILSLKTIIASIEFKYIKFFYDYLVASYPKSGNTWVRSFLTSLITILKDGKFDFEKLKKIRQYPLSSDFFDPKL